MSGVTQLGYLGIGVSDITAWEEFATGVLGLEVSGKDPDGTLFLRMDENHHRFALHPSGSDDILYAGWETRDEPSLRQIAAQLESQGVKVAWASAAEARERRVMGLIKVQDPDGVANEVYYGPLIEFERPFQSPRAIGGFETGNMGLGHYVIAVTDYHASLNFYRDGLGLLISDFIEYEDTSKEEERVVFLHCNPRHHSVAFFQWESPKRLMHFMLQLRRLDDVGITHYLCQDRRVPIAMSLGRHTNDHMVSFYMETPSGFEVEYGFGAREIDDSEWEVQLHRAPSMWGHRRQSATPLLPEST